MNSSLDRVIQTLSLVEVRGRQNLTLLLQATLFLEQEGIAEALKCLEVLTVNGKANVDMVLGCILTLEEIQKEKEQKEEQPDEQ